MILIDQIKCNNIPKKNSTILECGLTSANYRAVILPNRQLNFSKPIRLKVRPIATDEYRNNSEFDEKFDEKRHLVTRLLSKLNHLKDKFNETHRQYFRSLIKKSESILRKKRSMNLKRNFEKSFIRSINESDSKYKELDQFSKSNAFIRLPANESVDELLERVKTLLDTMRIKIKTKVSG